MIKLFKENDTTFNSNGDLIIKPTRAIVHKEDNGSFYLDLETNLNEEKKIVEPEAGTTIEITNGSQIQNVDTTKEIEFSLQGNTSQATTTGKNLLNYVDNLSASIGGLTSVINSDGSITTNGTPTYDYVAIIGYDITSKLEVGATYTISQHATNNYLYVQINAHNNSTGTNSYYYLVNRTSQSFVVEANTTYRILVQSTTMNNWGTSTRNITNFYQIEKNSSATSFEQYTGGIASPNPSYPQQVKNVSGLQNVFVNGKNYLNLKDENVFRKSITGIEYDILSPNSIYLETPGSAYSRVWFYLDLPNVDTIRVSAKARANEETLENVGIGIDRFYKGETTRNVYNEVWFTPADRESGTTKSFNMTNIDTTKYMYCLSFFISQTRTTANKVEFYDIQIETGTTTTDFEAYRGNECQINLGKNMYIGSQDFGGTWTNASNWLTAEETYQDLVVMKRANAWNGLYKTMNVIAGETYTFSAYVKSDQSRSMAFYVADGSSNMAKLSPNNKAFTSTTEWQKYSITFIARTSGIIRARIENTTTIANSYSYVCGYQLEKNYKPTSYSPYFTPIELCKIGNYKDLIFKSKGTNLANPEKLNLGKTLTENGVLTNSSTRTTLYQNEIEPNTNYVVSVNNNYQIGNLFYYDINKTFLSLQTSAWGNNKQITTPTKACYISFATRLSTDATMTQGDLELIQVNLAQGTTQQIYEPYGSKGKWLLHKEIGKVVLNGSESWQLRNDVSQASGYYTFRNDDYIAGQFNSNGFGYSNYFEIATSGNAEKNNIRLIDTTHYGTTICIDGNIAQTSNALKTWLQSHNTIVYFIKKVPTTTEITNEELIEQLDQFKLISGLNNILISTADLPAIMDLTYNKVSGGEVITSYIDYLQPNRILVANTPQGEQAFRIGNVEKTRSKIRLQANHVFYDSANYIIKDSFVVEKDCNDALDHLNNATDQTTPFTTTSDINTIASYRCVRNSLYEAIQVVLERWGGHLVRNNFNIGIMNSIGNDNGVVVRYGKNLKDINASYDWSAVATKLMPVGQDGLLLPEEWLYSNIEYEIPYTKVVSFDQSNVEQDNYMVDDELDEEAYQQALIDDLRAKGNEYLATNSVPMVNYTLEANLERISDVGDTIEVIDEKLGIKLLTHLISFEYNCILDKYVQVQFGNFTPTLSGLMQTIAETTNQAIDESNAVLRVSLSNELQQATDQIWSVLGNSYVIYDGDKILVLDRLPKETAQNVIMINAGGIGFSNTGIDGTFTSAWTIDNTLNMQNVNVINLTADLIKGGTLKLGSNLNQYGQIEIYNETNNLIAEMNKNGLKMYGADGSYVLMNNQVGFAGYDRNGTKIYWADGDAFHMKKSEVEEEITLCGKMRYIPIQITDNGTITNDGIGLVSVLGGGN